MGRAGMISSLKSFSLPGFSTSWFTDPHLLLPRPILFFLCKGRKRAEIHLKDTFPSSVFMNSHVQVWGRVSQAVSSGQSYLLRDPRTKRLSIWSLCFLWGEAFPVWVWEEKGIPGDLGAHPKKGWRFAFPQSANFLYCPLLVDSNMESANKRKISSQPELQHQNTETKGEFAALS